MNLFLDSSVVLAAVGRPTGASRAVFELAVLNDWAPLTSDCVLGEVEANIPRLLAHAGPQWNRIRGQLGRVPDITSHP